ncbi:MAG TPA: TauD/TfdA family dioxygenase [Allosphingosinicella sp.]|jgi:alpha-ketoglutarate-dependent taurine dioxygenase
MNVPAAASPELAHPLPHAVEPSGDSSLAALLAHAERERPALDATLLRSGALLFRGWGADSLEDFNAFVTAFSGSEERFGYAGGASPRKGLGGKGLYSSTEYPPSMWLSLHNELSYAGVQPRRLFFFCLVAPESGGETTLADSRRILSALDPALVSEFRGRGLRYIRNLSPLAGSGYGWPDAFETDDPAEAEARARAIGADIEWRPYGILRVSQARPATAFHPETGEEVWFNQADGFHPTALGASAYAEQLALCGSEEDFRLNVTFADGAAIPPAALAHIRETLTAQTLRHRWQRGDILALDNHLAAHGRAPFEGQRKIALAMTPAL